MKLGVAADALYYQNAGVHNVTKHIIQMLPTIDSEIECVELGKPTNPGSNQRSTIQRLKTALKTIPRQAKEQNLDVVLEPAHFGPFNLPKSIKRVTYIHDLTPVHHPEWHPMFSARAQQVLLPKIIKRADLVLTNSLFTKNDIIKTYGIAEHKIHYAHLGVESDYQTTCNRAQMAEHGIHKPYILFLGTLEPRKNLIRLISAFEQFKTRNPNNETQLILAGQKGWKSQDIITKKYNSEHKDDIILLGYVKRDFLPTLYSQAKVFVYPSLYEGFGLPVLEALACGTTVVTSDVTSLPEVANGHAVLCDPYETMSLCTAIEEAYFSDKDTTAQVNYARSLTWEKCMYEIGQSLHQLF